MDFLHKTNRFLPCRKLAQAKLETVGYSVFLLLALEGYYQTLPH